MTSQAQTIVPPLGMTLGPLYIGSTIAAILFGITNLEVVIYYKKYPHDWWVYRYCVGVLWVLDSLHVTFSTHAMYHYLVDSFGEGQENSAFACCVDAFICVSHGFGCVHLRLHNVLDHTKLTST
ncbi:hypothetical protein EDD85DRAFT_795166 [Armillaria nabsnona]|nr:hypothetical protein EDD85DRAFT_795166 [Armillaria nabsnona]